MPGPPANGAVDPADEAVIGMTLPPTAGETFVRTSCCADDWPMTTAPKEFATDKLSGTPTAESVNEALPSSR